MIPQDPARPTVTDLDWWHETGMTGAEMEDIWGPRDPVTGEPSDTWPG